MRDKITKQAVDSLEAAGGKEATLWDTKVSGFGVRARPGGSKTYVVRYRPAPGGRSSPLRTLKIGVHGSPWTADQARDEAKRLLGLVASGADPAADLSAGRLAPTVADLAARFKAEHVETKSKARTNSEYGRLIDSFVLPALGKMRVADVTRRDIGKVHHGLRETPYQANRVIAVLSKMFNLAEQWGMRTDGSNPCRHLEKFREAQRERMLSGDELARLGKALGEYTGSAYVIAAIKLLVFSGARLSEILGLHWEWIDLQRGEARLPDSKTGKKTLHLPPPALEVLAELPRVEGNPHVIVGHVTGARLVNLEKPWRQIRAAAGLDDVRLHDLRHAFASIAGSSGMALPIIGRLLGHTQAATTQRYLHLASDPLKTAAASIAGKIASAMASKAESAEVIPIRSAG